jgi:cell division protein FtsB
MPPLETVDMVREEVEAAEAELNRQSMRRREMESEMNALKKRHNIREESTNRYGGRRR